MTFLVAGYAILVAPWFSSSLVAIGLSAGAVGVGMGLANLTTLVAAQTSVAPQRIGVATSTVMLFRTFGAAFAVSVMARDAYQMQSSLGQSRPPPPSTPLWAKLANPQNLLEPLTRAQVPADLLPKLIASLSDALWYAFLTGFVLMLLGLAVSFFMANYTPANTPRGGEASRV